MFRNKFLYLVIFLFFIAHNGFCQKVISVNTLLADIIDPSSVAVWPKPSYATKQASSYDRNSIAADKPGWFANGDFNQFIRQEEKNEHREFVMMDAAGPGAVVRFWLTTQVKPGRLRFYFDNETKPTLEIPA